MTGVAESCRPNCQGLGWPRPAKATPAVANRAAMVTATAVKGENTFICLSAPCCFKSWVMTVDGQRALLACADRNSMAPPASGEACATVLVGRRRWDGEIPIPQTTNPGLLQCTLNRSVAGLNKRCGLYLS